MNYYQYGGVDLWEQDIIVNDEFDSDQLDEDESYSWASGITDQQETCIANWRGWKSSGLDSRQQQQMASYQQRVKSANILLDSQAAYPYSVSVAAQNQAGTNTGRVLKLVDVCARYIALNMPFELVESFAQPVPEDLQLKITFASFPDSVEDIRLYSCLANGNADEYVKGEQLYNNKNVRNILQIGFHLSATVVPSCNGSTKVQNVNVAVVCDRKRITSCHCTCSKPSSWCSHIVAVCIARILDAQSVELRAPVSESLSKLQRDQLQKFAQYLISELPQQILPTAQKLLDELLKGNESSMNLLSGAPDPTAGSSTHDISVWCLDEQLLQENIHKTLSKFIIPSPHVVSDIDYLAHSSSAASAEYTSLLRPLRGREPEGMWNLVSIVKELLRKRDKNSIPLLRIITSECVNLDQVVHLWFLIKVSPLYNERGMYNQRQHNHNHHTPPVHQACASLLDEIVSLWRIACLNPMLVIEDKTSFKELLTNWQKQSYEKLRKFCNSAPDKIHLLRRLDPELFSAFQPAIESCQMTWDGFDFESAEAFKRLCLENLPAASSALPLSEPVVTVTLPSAIGPTKSDSSSSEGFCEESTSKAPLTNEDLTDSVFDADTNATTSLTIEPALTINDNQKLDVLFSRCEALYAHGYIEQACNLAKILAEYMLASYNNEKIYDDLMSCKNPSCCSVSAVNTDSMKNKYITNFQCCVLWRSVMLSTILLETSQHNQLAFRIGIFALEIPRQPASTKALEVKLFNQEQDLVLLLKRIPISEFELTIQRDRAKRIKDYLAHNVNFNKCKCNNSNYLPIMLASFIFDSLYHDKNASITDELIGFDAAVAALAYKPNVSEVQHAIYCEGIRRQKGDLAIALLLTYKDDQSRLLKIMDKILDKEIHVLFKSPTNPFQPNLKRIQQNNLQKTETIVAATASTITPIPTATNAATIAVKQALASSVNTTPTKTVNRTATPVTPSVPAPVMNTTVQPAAALSTLSTQAPQASGNSKAVNNVKYSAIDSLSSGWEESESEGSHHNSRLLETKFRCLNLNKQNNLNSKKSNFDSSAPETTSSDNSPTINRKSNWMPAAAGNSTLSTSQTTPTVTIVESEVVAVDTTTTEEACASVIATTSKEDDGESDNDSGQSQSSNVAEITPGNKDNNNSTSSILTVSGEATENDASASKTANMTTKPWVDGSFNEYVEPETTTSITNDEPNEAACVNLISTQAENLSELLSSMLTSNPNEFLNVVASTVASTACFSNFNNNNKQNRSKGNKNKAPVFPNQPSEALAHFMFDFSKTVLSKAGGPISTSVFLNHNNTGPHRNLHICAFLIALYALGLHNCVQTNWLSRTYSSHVSWINGQAAEIGYPAICILIECWEGHLTPSECALLADRVSRGRDTMAVKAAAELALSSLKYAHSLNLQEIQRALIQCKEQSSDMLQRACLIVENSVKEGNNANLADVLFEVAKRWDELYIESMRNQQQHAVQQQQQANDLMMDPAIVSSSVAHSAASLQQQQAVVAAAAAVAVTNNYMQPPPMNLVDPMVHTQFQYMQPAPAPPSMQVQNPQAAPFAFAVQTMPYHQYVAAPQQQNNGPPQMHIPPNLFIPAMYTAYGTIVPTPPPNQGPPSQQHHIPQNMIYQQNPTNSHPYPQQQQQQMDKCWPQAMPCPPNVNAGFLFQNQIAQMMTAANTNQAANQQQKPVEIDSVSMKHLLSAFRVGMLALEALPRRVDSSHQIKYLRSPVFGDNVKWLWSISVKLGTNSLQQFCQTAANVIQNPFLIQELAFDSANHLCRSNPAHFTHALRSPMLNVLVQRCLNSYFRCCMQKMHHLSPNDHEDFINMVVTARNAFYYSGNMSCFSELLQNLKKSKACKKDLWSKLYNALANTNTNTSNYS